MDSIIQTLTNRRQYLTFLNALSDVDLTATLEQNELFTVFAPTDAAFEDMTDSQIKRLFEDKQNLTIILNYHLVPGKFLTKDLLKLDSLKTLEGDSLSVSAIDITIMIDDAQIIHPDIQANNGVIQGIDTVLSPGL